MYFWLRFGFFPMAMGLFWLGIAVYFSMMGDFGPGMPTVVGVGLMGAFSLGGGMYRFYRDVFRPKKGDKAAPVAIVARLINDDVPVPAIDVDAAFQRYMANRPVDAPAPVAPADPYADPYALPEAAAPPPPRGFGRKGL